MITLASEGKRGKQKGKNLHFLNPILCHTDPDALCYYLFSHPFSSCFLNYFYNVSMSQTTPGLKSWDKRLVFV